MPQPFVPIAEIPLHGRKLTERQYREVEQLLQDWKKEVLAAARRHPRGSFELGMAQVESYLNLVGRLTAVTPAAGLVSESGAEAARWMERYALHELSHAVDSYIDKIRSALLYGLRQAENPLTIASRMYHATKEGEVDWRRI